MEPVVTFATPDELAGPGTRDFYLGILSHDEKVRLARLLSPAKQELFLLAHGLLRTSLSRISRTSTGSTRYLRESSVTPRGIVAERSIVCRGCLGTLSMIVSTAGHQGPAPQAVLYCSFCGKAQHEVNKLVAGPAVFICDECIDLCSDIIDEQLLRLIEGDEESGRAMSTERMSHYVEHAKKGEQRNRLVL